MSRIVEVLDEVHNLTISSTFGLVSIRKVREEYISILSITSTELSAHDVVVVGAWRELIHTSHCCTIAKNIVLKLTTKLHSSVESIVVASIVVSLAVSIGKKSWCDPPSRIVREGANQVFRTFYWSEMLLIETWIVVHPVVIVASNTSRDVGPSQLGVARNYSHIVAVEQAVVVGEEC